MKLALNIFYFIFIAFIVWWNLKDFFRLYAFASTSTSQVAAWIRYLCRLKARERAIEYIFEYTKGYREDNNHRVRDIMLYHLQLDSSWYSNYLEWGWSEAESTLSDTLDRVRQFIKEWTDENPFIYTAQLEEIWKVHKGSYMDRGQNPNVPKQLRPE